MGGGSPIFRGAFLFYDSFPRRDITLLLNLPERGEWTPSEERELQTVLGDG